MYIDTPRVEFVYSIKHYYYEIDIINPFNCLFYAVWTFLTSYKLDTVLIIIYNNIIKNAIRRLYYGNKAI